MNRHKANPRSTVIPILLALAVTLFSACASKQEKARQAVEESLKAKGIATREMVVDLFHPADNMPDKAYIAVTVTYNFASSSGSFQKEYLGFILKQDGPNWAVESSTVYTKDKDRAELALAGRKK